MTDTEQLKALLISQFNDFTQLLQLETRKSEVLMAGDMPQLDKIVNTEQAFVMRISQLEKKQAEFISKNYPQGFGISQITAYYVKDSKEEFQDLLEKLTVTVEHIQKVNKLNQTLLKTRLDMVNYITERIGLFKNDNGRILDISADSAAGNPSAGEKHYLINRKI